MSVKENFYTNPPLDLNSEYTRIKRRFNKHLRDNKADECRVHNDFIGTCTSQGFTEDEKIKYCDENDNIRSEYKCGEDRPKCRKQDGTELGICYPDYNDMTVQNAIKNKITNYNDLVNNSNTTFWESIDENKNVRSRRKYLSNSKRYKDYKGDWLDYSDGHRNTVETATQDVNAMIVHDNNNYVLGFICASAILVSTLFLIRSN